MTELTSSYRPAEPMLNKGLDVADGPPAEALHDQGRTLPAVRRTGGRQGTRLSQRHNPRRCSVTRTTHRLSGERMVDNDPDLIENALAEVIHD